MSKLVRAVMFTVVKAKTFFALGEPSQFDAVFMKHSTAPGDDEMAASKSSSSSSTCSSPIELSPSPIIEDGGRSRVTYCMKMTFLAMTGLAMAFIVIMVCRDYLKFLLLWMEQINLWAATVIFAVLFTLVSFPMMWGYIVLNVAAGYLYGVALGSIIVIVCAFIGVFIGHELTKRFLNEYVLSKIATGLGNESLRAILRVIEGGRAFKVVALARLTPIPFGLQNGIFAISNIRRLIYLSATCVGCLPTQVLNCYIGSTLRSMEEVFRDTKSLTAYIVFIGQLILTVALMAYVIRRARREFNRIMEEMETASSSKNDEEKGGKDVSKEKCVYQNGTHTRHLSKVDLINENVIKDKTPS